MRSSLAKAPSDGDNGINNSGGAIIPAKSLKRGSVLDVLNSKLLFFIIFILTAEGFWIK